MLGQYDTHRPDRIALMTASLQLALRHVPVAFAFAISVMILFTPASGVPTAPPGTDKVIHLVLFAVLMITALMARWTVPASVSVLVIYAAVSEVVQALLPLGRSGDLADAAVDVLGIALGWALFALARRIRTAG